jgi:HSP20 family protein
MSGGLAAEEQSVRNNKENESMNLTRWEPFRDMLSLQDRTNRLFNDPYVRLTAPTEAVGGWFPLVDIHEDAERIVLRAEVPGVNRDDIEVSVENGTLTLRGEKKHAKETESENAYRQERFYGFFTRSFVLPSAIDSEHINATYKDGVLEVVVPKAEEARPRKIAIQSGAENPPLKTVATKVRSAS